jgi:hypothetical protein
MSKKHHWKSAKDLMAELESDPQYQRRIAEKNERLKDLESKYDLLSRPVLDKLRAEGFDSDSIEGIVKKYSPLPEEVISVLIEGVASSLDARHSERLVRALGAAGKPFEGTALAVKFDETSDISLKWAIANTIALARPHSIDKWIENAPEQSFLKKTLDNLGYFR